VRTISTYRKSGRLFILREIGILRQPSFLDTANSTAFIDLPQVSQKWAQRMEFWLGRFGISYREGLIWMKTLSH